MNAREFMAGSRQALTDWTRRNQSTPKGTTVRPARHYSMGRFFWDVVESVIEASVYGMVLMVLLVAFHYVWYSSFTPLSPLVPGVPDSITVNVIWVLYGLALISIFWNKMRWR